MFPLLGVCGDNRRRREAPDIRSSQPQCKYRSCISNTSYGATYFLWPHRRSFFSRETRAVTSSIGPTWMGMEVDSGHGNSNIPRCPSFKNISVPQGLFPSGAGFNFPDRNYSTQIYRHRPIMERRMGNTPWWLADQSFCGSFNPCWKYVVPEPFYHSFTRPSG